MVERLDTTRVSGLPPRDVWLWDPEIEDKLETPLDERGLVDLDALVGMVRKTVTPSYQWESPFNDIHHLQWEASRYVGKTNDETQMMRDFRELASRKALVPRIFHNWVHRITEPSSLPSEEVMQYSVDAERVALSLAQQAMMATRITRNKRVSERARFERLKYAFESYTTTVDNARLVPLEYRRVPLEVIDINSPEELPFVARELGRLAIDRVPERRRALLVA
jgi:hypothetical protein